MIEDFIPKNFQWCEWLCKTNFSFLQGASHPEEIVGQAMLNDYTSICINDFDGVYGLARTHLKLRALAKEVGKNLRFHCATEIHLEKDHQSPLLLQETLVLLALNKKGYRQICEVLTYAHRESKNQAVISLSELSRFDLSETFAIQPMRGLIRKQSLLRVKRRYGLIKEIMGGAVGTGFEFT